MGDDYLWDPEVEKNIDIVVDELKRYGIGAMRYPPGNVSAWLPGGKPVEFIYTNPTEKDSVMTGVRYPDMGMAGTELLMDLPQLIPVTMVICKVCKDYGEDVKDDDLEELARFKEIFSAQAGKLFKESGPFALIAEYGITPEELKFIDSFSL